MFLLEGAFAAPDPFARISASIVLRKVSNERVSSEKVMALRALEESWWNMFEHTALLAVGKLLWRQFMASLFI